MNRISLLLTVIAVLSGCQSTGPDLNGVRSVYSGGNSVLYQVQSQSNSPDQAMQMAAMAYQAGDLDQALVWLDRVVELICAPQGPAQTSQPEHPIRTGKASPSAKRPRTFDPQQTGLRHPVAPGRIGASVGGGWRRR